MYSKGTKKEGILTGTLSIVFLRASNFYTRFKIVFENTKQRNKNVFEAIIIIFVDSWEKVSSILNIRNEAKFGDDPLQFPSAIVPTYTQIGFSDLIFGKISTCHVT